MSSTASFSWTLEPLLIEARILLDERDQIATLASRIDRRRRAALAEATRAHSDATSSRLRAARELDETIRVGAPISGRVLAEKHLRETCRRAEEAALALESAAEEARRSHLLAVESDRSRDDAEAGVRELERLRERARRQHLRSIEQAEERRRDDDCAGRHALSRRSGPSMEGWGGTATAHPCPTPRRPVGNRKDARPRRSR